MLCFQFIIVFIYLIVHAFIHFIVYALIVCFESHQIQAVCLHSSAPCFFSGPHLGVISDNALVKKYPPPLLHDELVLGDKAYTDRSLAHLVIAPIKKKRNQPQTRTAERYNRVHGWYRASIEHTFGYMKRFKIISKRLCIEITLYSCMFTIYCCSRMMCMNDSRYNVSW
jgi:hypothetical protein